jgi:hypothetical protein
LPFTNIRSVFFQALWDVEKEKTSGKRKKEFKK